MLLSYISENHIELTNELQKAGIVKNSSTHIFKVGQIGYNRQYRVGDDAMKDVTSFFDERQPSRGCSVRSWVGLARMTVEGFINKLRVIVNQK